MSTDDLVLSAFLREEKFAYRYASVIEDEMFEEYPHKVCINAYLMYFKQYGNLPSLEELNSEIHRYCVKFRVDPAVESTVLALALKCTTMEYNIEYVQDIFVRFATKNKMTSVVLEAAQLIKTKGDQLGESDYEHIQNILTEAMSIKSRETEGVLFGDVADNPSEYIKSKNRYDPTTVIKTGIRTLDSGHIAGGPIPGELYIISAPPGRGKSTTLVNIGASAMMQGKDVVHIFVGDNTEADGVLRYCARMTGVTMSQIMLNSSTYLPTWNRLRENFHLGNLLIGAFPIGGPSVSDLRSYITKNMIQRSLDPKLLIIDYIDNCRRNYNRTSYEDLGEMYAQLKGIAEEMNLVCWTASQPKQEYWDSADNAGLASLAESSKKQHHIDGMITMKKVNETSYQMYVPKFRRGRSDYTIDVLIDYERMLLRESIPGRIMTPQGTSTQQPVSVDNMQAPASPY